MLGARDHVVLQFIALCQPVLRSHVQTLTATSDWSSARLMRRLFDGGYVNVFTDGMERGNLYTLTEAGRRELARVTGRQPADVRVVRTVRGHDDHHLKTIELLAAVHVACARARTDLLEVLLDRDIRKELGGNRAKDLVVPDAVIVIERGDERHAIAAEVDLGTENVSYVVRTKGVPYSEAWLRGTSLRGCSSWSVAVACTSLRRANRLALGLWEDEVPEGLFYFGTYPFDPGKVLRPGKWTTPRETPDGRALMVAESPFSTPKTTPQDRIGPQNEGDSCDAPVSGAPRGARFWSSEVSS